MTPRFRPLLGFLLIALSALGGSSARTVLNAAGPSVTVSRAERPDAERPAPQHGDAVATQARTRSPAPRHDDGAPALAADVVRLAAAGLPHRDTGLEAPAPVTVALAAPFDATAPPVLLTA